MSSADHFREVTARLRERRDEIRAIQSGELAALREVLDAALAFQKATNNAYLANVGWSSTSVGDLRPPFTGTQWDEYRAMERAIDRYDALVAGTAPTPEAPSRMTIPNR